MRSKILATAVLGVIGSVAIALPAQAVQRNCSSAARMCVYYNSKPGLGAEFGTDYSTPSLNPYVTTNDIYFKAGQYGSAGAASWVWNNAAAMRNMHPFVRIAMFQNSAYEGKLDIVDPGDVDNLVNTKNDNASLGWGR